MSLNQPERPDDRRAVRAVAKAPVRRRTRVFRALGGLVALALTVALVVFVGYASANLEELKAEVPNLDGRSQGSPLERAADGAIGYAQELVKPPASNGEGPAYVLSTQPPKGVTAPAGHWCPTTVIGYRIDFTASQLAGSTPRLEKARWRQALDEWTAASGGRYRFEYRGPATYRVLADSPGGFPVDPRLVPDSEIAITYAVPPSETDGKWKGYVHPVLSDALGVAGVGPVDWHPKSPHFGLIRQGMIVLDALDAVSDPHAVPTPYVHESGHALGLGHVDDTGQIMNTHAGSTSVINDGDTEGIRRLASLGCS